MRSSSITSLHQIHRECILPGITPLPDGISSAKWEVCLGRLKLPVLPLTRIQLKTKQGGWLGQHSAPAIDSPHGFVSATLAKVYEDAYRAINRAKVAFKVITPLKTDLHVDGEQRIFATVESCGLNPNLMSIIRDRGLKEIRFKPRVLLEPSPDVPHGWRIKELITFDLDLLPC